MTLIDIARSISAAQGTLQQPCSDFLLSVEPLELPFPSNEPKTAVAKAKLESVTIEGELHDEHAKLLREALEEMGTSHTGPWCLPRRFAQEPPRVAKKRKLERFHLQEATANDGSVTVDPEELPESLLSGLARRGQHPRSNSYKMRLLGEQLNDNEESEPLEADTSMAANDSDCTALLEVSPVAGSATYRFRIPRHASFYLGDCSDARSFRAAIRDQAQQHSTRKCFDFILLDPPWPNRSVKRTHKTAGSTYPTVATLDGVRDLLLGMDLDMLMADDCLVGIWITNKPAIRELVLGEDGIFDCWGVELTEEWVWLKTTTYGEPVTQLDAVWRKPYEVLLLGRRRSFNTAASAEQKMESEPKRRVIICVPDMHSRKPCLKELIEPLMSDRKDYRALEVFARHLVAGWWSWGNECVKFNWDGYWQKAEDVALP